MSLFFARCKSECSEDCSAFPHSHSLAGLSVVGSTAVSRHRNLATVWAGRLFAPDVGPEGPPRLVMALYLRVVMLSFHARLKGFFGPLASHVRVARALRHLVLVVAPGRASLSASSFPSIPV